MRRLFLALALLLGCKSVDPGGLFGENHGPGSGSTEPTGSTPCTPGSVVLGSQCETGGIGGASFETRVCLDDGSGYGPSTCPGEGGAGGAG